MKVTLVEDEKNLRLTVKTSLMAEGFEVEEFPNGQAALDSLNKNKNPPDLYLLDIMMPVMDGIVFLQKFKSLYPDVPAMFLTSRDEEFDKVLGLELGADDYLCKPFSMKELIARIKVILRRSSRSENPLVKNCSGIQLNCSACTARVNGIDIPLTVSEFRLLELFIDSPETVFSREQLIGAVYPEDTYLNDRAIDCHIKRLRKKIGMEKIETVYGLGYKFCEK